MVRQIAPLFVTMDIPATRTYYNDRLGFECLAGSAGLCPSKMPTHFMPSTQDKA
jgi:hypothetical protein